MPSTLLVGARGEQGRRGVVDADERQHQPRRVVRGQLLVQHDLFGDRHAAAPFARASAAPRIRRCAVRRTRTSGSERTPRRRRRSAPARQSRGTCCAGTSRGPSSRNSSEIASRSVTIARRPFRLQRQQPLSVLVGLHRDGLGREPGLHRAAQRLATGACSRRAWCPATPRPAARRAARPVVAPRPAGHRARPARLAEAQLDRGRGRDPVAGVEVLAERSIGASSGQNAAPPSPATSPTATCGSARYAVSRHQHHVAQHRHAAAEARFRRPVRRSSRAAAGSSGS